MSDGRTNSRTLLLLSGLITLVLWQFEIGRLVLYPFTLLASYAHEMGHGLTAVLLGGHFRSLELFPNGSGVARYDVASKVATAFVAAGGLVGPSVAGSLLLVLGRRPRWAKIVLFALGLLMALSVPLYVHNGFGRTFVASVAVVLMLIARIAPAQVALLVLQFVSVQLCLAVFRDLDYMFSPGGEVDGRPMQSDSMAIANVLFPPYWLWGGLTALFSFVVLALGLRVALKPLPAPAPRKPARRGSGR